MGIPAIVTAGDRGAAKAIYDESKVFLEIAGRPLVAHVVEALQGVDEISEVWVVGNAVRLEMVLAESKLRTPLTKPLHICEQHRNLYENAWETYKRALPGAPPGGREPVSDADHDFEVLYISGDLPFATPEEISDFIRRGQALHCDYALGLARAESLDPYLKRADGGPGLEIAFFNTRDGRLRQNNLHLARPSRVRNRHLIEDMYRYRYMREFHNMSALAMRLLFVNRGIVMIFFYLVMHLAGLADRNGLQRLADMIRRLVTVRRVEWGIARIMNCDFRLVVTELGGCAIDVDNEEEYDTIRANFDDWLQAQGRMVEAFAGEAGSDPGD